MTAAAEKPERWWRYVRKRRLICPWRHHIPRKQDFPESGFVQCDHWIAAEKRECGLWVFLYAIRGGGCVIVQVDLADMNAMEDLSTPTEMLEYLNIFPPFIV